jgi:hypothetical protein
MYLPRKADRQPAELMTQEPPRNTQRRESRDPFVSFHADASAGAPR